MQWVGVLLIAVAALLGLRSQQSRHKPFRTRSRREKPAVDEIVLLLEEKSDKTITLVAPVIRMRTTERKELRWVVAMTGDYDERSSISLENFRRDGVVVDIFQHSELTHRIPKSGKWRKLKAVLKKKDELPEGDAIYTYDIVFSRDGEASAQRSASGELEVCPVWPCD